VWKPGGDITFDPLSSVDRNMHAVSDGKLLVVLVKGAGRDFAHVTAPPPCAFVVYASCRRTCFHLPGSKHASHLGCAPSYLSDACKSAPEASCRLRSSGAITCVIP